MQAFCINWDSIIVANICVVGYLTNHNLLVKSVLRLNKSDNCDFVSVIYACLFHFPLPSSDFKVLDGYMWKK